MDDTDADNDNDNNDSHSNPGPVDTSQLQPHRGSTPDDAISVTSDTSTATAVDPVEEPSDLDDIISVSGFSSVISDILNNDDRWRVAPATESREGSHYSNDDAIIEWRNRSPSPVAEAEGTALYRVDGRDSVNDFRELVTIYDSSSDDEPARPPSPDYVVYERTFMPEITRVRRMGDSSNLSGSQFDRSIAESRANITERCGSELPTWRLEPERFQQYHGKPPNFQPLGYGYNENHAHREDYFEYDCDLDGGD